MNLHKAMLIMERGVYGSNMHDTLVDKALTELHIPNSVWMSLEDNPKDEIIRDLVNARVYDLAVEAMKKAAKVLKAKANL